MNLKLNNIGPISQADISIAKINLVGGANSSGKSTVSKILYSYLKSQKDDESLEYLMDSEGITDFNDSDISFNVNFNPEEVFYIESISMLDLKDLEILRIDHIKTIKDALESDGDSQNQKINSYKTINCFIFYFLYRYIKHKFTPKI